MTGFRGLALAFASLFLAAGGLPGSGLESPAKAEAYEPVLIPYLVVEGRERPAQSLHDAMEEAGVEAASWALIRNGEVTAQDTVTADRRHLPAETLFQAASLSKPVTTLGVLRLVSAKRLDIDADVNRYLKGWQVDYSGYEGPEKVTIRRLLSHRGGTTVHGFEGYEPGAAIPSTLGVLKGEGNSDPVVLMQRPGAGYSYSGGGTTILQLLIEEQSGEGFGAYMEREVLKPLGLVNSHFRDEPGLHFAAAHDGNGRPYDQPYHIYPEKAAAGLWTSARDMARFLLALDSIAAGERPDYLAPDLAAQIVEIPTGEADASYALGLGIDRRGDWDVLQHTGSNWGYRSVMFFDRKRKSGAVMLTNGENGQVVTAAFARGAARSLGFDFMEQRHVTPAEPAEADWSLIEGEWRIVGGPLDGRQYDFTRIGDSDLAALDQQDSTNTSFLAIGPLSFIGTDTTAPLEFSRSEAGDPQALFVGEIRLEKVPGS